MATSKIKLTENKTDETVIVPSITENQIPPVETYESKNDENVIVPTVTENEPPPTEDTENKIDEVVTIPTIIVNEPTKEETTETKAKRVAKTTNFTNQTEFAYIDGIVTARVDASITKDWSHFIRQCIDYTINQRFFDADFATGKEDFYLLKDAFFTEAPIKK